MNDDLKESILSIVEASLDAQLRAVRRLRQGSQVAPRPSRRKGLSQVDMAYDVLKKARSHPLFLWRRRRSREPRLFPHQEGRPPGPLPAHRQEYLRPASGDPMTLLAAYLEIVADWRSVFPQARSWKRAVRQSLGSLVCLGRTLPATR